MTILVTGATGHVGRHVVRGLLDAGQPVRAGSRSLQPGTFPEGVEGVRVDLTDPSTLPPALEGATGVFLYAQADEAEAFGAAARDAGVEQVVLLSSASVLFPDAERNPIARSHLAVEQALDRAGLPRTFLRPSYFATNALRWTTIRTERRLRTSFPEGRTTMVHERDIADVAVASLLDERHRGAAYALLGAGVSTVREQARAIADALAEPVELQEVDVDAYRDELLQHMPEAIVDRLIRVRGDAPVPSADVAVDQVQAVLGRRPRTFAEWARDHVDDFR